MNYKLYYAIVNKVHSRFDSFFIGKVSTGPFANDHKSVLNDVVFFVWSTPT